MATNDDTEVEVGTADSNYKVPEKTTIVDILNKDQDDEALKTYKAQLGLTNDNINLILEDKNPNQVIIKTLKLEYEGEDSVHNQSMDISDVETSNFKKTPFVMKEGARYRIIVEFYVQREIVSGLKYTHKAMKGIVPIAADTETEMLGSYGPKRELRTYKSPIRDAPSGMLARGKYTIKSKFIDDDKKIHAHWDWCLEIKDKWKA